MRNCVYVLQHYYTLYKFQHSVLQGSTYQDLVKIPLGMVVGVIVRRIIQEVQIIIIVYQTERVCNAVGVVINVKQTETVYPASLVLPTHTKMSRVISSVQDVQQDQLL